MSKQEIPTWPASMKEAGQALLNLDKIWPVVKKDTTSDSLMQWRKFMVIMEGVKEIPGLKGIEIRIPMLEYEARKAVERAGREALVALENAERQANRVPFEEYHYAWSFLPMNFDKEQLRRLQEYCEDLMVGEINVVDYDWEWMRGQLIRHDDWMAYSFFSNHTPADTGVHVVEGGSKPPREHLTHVYDGPPYVMQWRPGNRPRSERWRELPIIESTPKCCWIIENRGSEPSPCTRNGRMEVNGLLYCRQHGVMAEAKEKANVSTT